ncbi:MAG: hypothetical protein M1835_005395 [Candelina submexicana]|nr:MAG: hypothetical protein M1835_005395 [Candelina submexicana]
MAPTMNNNYQAIVDMGSNGIRFSISDLTPPRARILPTVYQDRLGLSLYQAQYQTGRKTAINLDVMDQVIASLRRFKITCNEFGVPPDNIRILATEATREATNSVEFRSMIQEATGWEVELLTKQEEGRIGAMGVASSFSSVKGLVMDLGGGSMQLTWLIAGDGRVRMSQIGAVSLPYGAAALTQRLKYAHKSDDKAIWEDMRYQIRNAYESLGVPRELERQVRPVWGNQSEQSEEEESGYEQAEEAENKVYGQDGLAQAEQSEGFSLYLSGGGFRGWGYLLMSVHRVQPYPIPIINGFDVDWEEFKDTNNILTVAKMNDVFRVSEARANQVPAVAFLINVLAQTLPRITDVYFCQGGVREGKLYTLLPRQIRGLNPLPAATLAYAPPMANEIRQVLKGALPKGENNLWYLHIFNDDLLIAIANLMYYHQPLMKETRAAAALRSTTSGILAGAHGMSHMDRALLGLILCERWRAAMGPADVEFQRLLQVLVGYEVAWWAKYLGRISGMICDRYPAGTHSGGAPRISLSSCLKEHPTSVYLMVDVSIDPDVCGHALIKSVKHVEKINKNTTWPKGSFRLDVEADIRHAPALGVLQQ